jgi:curved DNA-binding protein CbpA
MKGTLSAQPLAELIREISIKGLSGTLRLQLERAQTAVYFDGGQLIYAASNLLTLRLRKYLSKRGIVVEKELRSEGNNLSDLDLAAALAAAGTVRQKDIDALLSILVRDVLRVALLWTEGTWDFNQRARLADPVCVKLDNAALLREAAQRMSINFVSQRFRNPTELISRASDVSPTSNFLPAESFILSRLDEPLSLRELVLTSGLPELDAYRVIYGLALSGLIRRTYWQNAFRTDTPKPTTEQAEISVAPDTSVSAPEQTDKWLAASIADDELETFLHRLKTATNYYEVIELPPTANASEIKDAYYAMARRYHPDRFHLKSGTTVHAEISSAFARVTQAYETLTDPTARSAYDQTLERSRQFWESAPRPTQVDTPDSVDDDEFAADAAETEFGRAEYSFREGFGALQQGRINAAVTHLAAASRLAPNEARYRAYYGRALAADEKTRRLAENELQAAVRLDPANAAFRIMLAELYFELKFHRRAQTELDRALAMDPKSATAHSLLRKLEKSRKVS